MDPGETIIGAVGEVRLASLLDALADAITIRGLDGRIHYANRAALEAMGMQTIEQLRAVDPHDLLFRHVITDVEGRELGVGDLPSMRLVRGGESPDPLTIRAVVRETGEERYQRLKASPLRDESGAIVAAATIIEDVTDVMRAQLRARFLAAADEVLASSLDYQETLRNVTRLAVPQVADWCAIDLFMPDGDTRETVALAHVDPAKLELAKRLRAYEPSELRPDAGVGLVRRTARPLLYAEIPDELLVRGARDAEHLRLLRDVGFRAALLVPMVARGETIGVLSLVSAESGRALSETDVEFASQIADRAALAVENARLYTERSEIATTLQRGLMPDRLPDIPGWELAAEYRPAGRENAVGGDFYDAFEADGAWLVIVGDVQGKGAAAATVTALARHTAWAVSRFDPRPASILRHVNEALRRRGGGEACTAVCLRIEGDRIEIAGGGHPLPLYVSGEGIGYVGQHGTLLGAFDELHIEERTLTIGPGEALVAFTDGVTDTRDATGERFGAGRLREALAGMSGESAQCILDRLLGVLDDFRAGPPVDDLAVLVMRFSVA